MRAGIWWDVRIRRCVRVAALSTALLCVGVVVPAASAVPAASGAAIGPTTSEDVCRSEPVLGYGFDQYGGWKGIHVASSARFTVREAGGRWWLFTPEGNAFFANGASGIEPIGDYIGGTSTSPYHENVLAKHGSDAAWADATVARLCGLGMHTMGGWVGPDDVERFAGRLTYTVNVDVYGAMPEVATGPGGIKVRRDVFVPDAEARAAAAIAGQPLVARCATDPWCVGVYVENEQPYAPGVLQGGTHLDTYLSEPAGAPGKQAVQAFFDARYGGDLAAFNATWSTALGAWDEIQGLAGLGDCAPDVGYLDDVCLLQSGDARRGDVLAFEAEVAGRAAHLADGALGDVEPSMLNLGPRLVVNPFVPEVLRAISEPADVLSVNNYDVSDVAATLLTPELQAALDDAGALSFDPFERLEQLHAITGKPLIVSEWFYRQARPDTTSYPPFLPEKPDAATRAAASGAYLERLLAMPFVVGEHWFQWQDQPIEGRFDGENQLIGIVDITDELNQPLYDTLARVYATLIERRLAEPSAPSSTTTTTAASMRAEPTFTG